MDQNKLTELLASIAKQRPSKPPKSGFANVGLHHNRSVETVGVYISETVDVIYVSYYPKLYESQSEHDKPMGLVFSEKCPDISAVSGKEGLKDSSIKSTDFHLLLGDGDSIHVRYHKEKLDSISSCLLKEFDENEQTCVNPACLALLISIKNDLLLKQKLYFM